MLHGIRVPQAPQAEQERIAQGRIVFERQGCHTCHAGPAWTTSHLPGQVGTLAPHGEVVIESVLHNVGTFDPARDVLGEKGFDVPTLLDLHATTPYFHTGDATTLEELLAHQEHSGLPLNNNDRADLITFLQSIDETTKPFIAE